MRNHAEKLPAGDFKREDIADLACTFQNIMAEVLKDRCQNAIARFKDTYGDKASTLVVSGGVAANTAIRAALGELCDKQNIRFYAPPLNLCQDNAAMIAWAGVERFRLGLVDTLDFKARPRWPLDPDAPPRHGAGVKA